MVIHDKTHDWIKPSVKCYSLGKKDFVNLDWITGSVDIIGVYSQNLFDVQYVSLVGNDITVVKRYSNLKPFCINDYRFDKNYFKDLIELESIRITRARNQIKNRPPSISTTTAETTNPQG